MRYNASFGENLAKASNEEQAGNLNITAGWYLNPSHRQNLLEKRFTKIGVAYYEIDGITYIACEFGL
ncbi:CAP domain-containing protein [Butyrivibrio sp. WCD3002]|uniref:CAP domain-containing protein n=1 Tax=Butyrivibrio sp. WCD3002 TaxID=1280676 RepID=UPI0003F4DA41|nr:CAP domain-containing protein [Butyrivibrio sp. WCD3002]